MPAFAGITNMKNDLIKIGIFGPAHGVRGQISLRSFTDNPKDILAYTLTDATGARQYTLKCDGVKGKDLIVSVDGIADRNAAESLKNTAVYAPESVLPEASDDEFYHSQLVGMRALTTDGKAYGTVLAVHNYGAGDILEFELAGGGNEMLPFKDAFIGEIDRKKRTIVVFPPYYVEAKEG
ncbi:MAG: 16S rRNA processing protein RimM [Alphaproteobacteria bacterium]|nr:16S rRNA processing protein RimM [Alphaproteobacteria bacterium]